MARRHGSSRPKLPCPQYVGRLDLIREHLVAVCRKQPSLVLVGLDRQSAHRSEELGARRERQNPTLAVGTPSISSNAHTATRPAVPSWSSQMSSSWLRGTSCALTFSRRFRRLKLRTRRLSSSVTTPPSVRGRRRLDEPGRTARDHRAGGDPCDCVPELLKPARDVPTEQLCQSTRNQQGEEADDDSANVEPAPRFNRASCRCDRRGPVPTYPAPPIRAPGTMTSSDSPSRGLCRVVVVADRSGRR
jgi:hypothetical protein